MGLLLHSRFQIDFDKPILALDAVTWKWEVPSYSAQAEPCRCCPLSSNVEVVKNLPLEFQNAPLKKSTHQNGAYATIRGEGMVWVPSKTLRHGMCNGFFTASLAAMRLNNLQTLDVVGLLAAHSAILDELTAREVIRSKNNPTGDYAEWLVAQKLGLKLEANSSKGFDAKDARGKRYQIKGRRVTPENRSTLLGVIRNLEGNDFDFLVAVIFEEDWTIRCAAKIPHKEVMDLASFRSHTNGHTMSIRPSVFENRHVKDISHQLRG